MPLSIFAHGLRQNHQPKRSRASKIRKFPSFAHPHRQVSSVQCNIKPPSPLGSNREMRSSPGNRQEREKKSVCRHWSRIPPSRCAECRLVLELGWFSAIFSLLLPYFMLQVFKEIEKCCKSCFYMYLCCDLCLNRGKNTLAAFCPLWEFAARAEAGFCTC